MTGMPADTAAAIEVIAGEVQRLTPSWVRHNAPGAHCPATPAELRGSDVREPRARSYRRWRHMSAAQKAVDLTQDGMPSAEIASDSKPAIFQVRRPDTLQFGSLQGLARMAGVSRNRLRRLIAKEVTDNALDECDRIGRPGQVWVAHDEDADRYAVIDNGCGIPGDAPTLADLFSSKRSMLSAKFSRLPERGALGNGLRCLVAAVALSSGTITVEARGRRTLLRPRRIGDTEIVAVTGSPRVVGTWLDYTLSGVIPPDADDLRDAEGAIALARAAGSAYIRRPSPHWLDVNNMAETFSTIEPRDATVRQVVERLDGRSGAMAGRIAADFGKGRTCRSMSEQRSLNCSSVLAET